MFSGSSGCGADCSRRLCDYRCGNHIELPASAGRHGSLHHVRRVSREHTGNGDPRGTIDGRGDRRSGCDYRTSCFRYSRIRINPHRFHGIVAGLPVSDHDPPVVPMYLNSCRDGIDAVRLYCN